jgi:hypothetical protein
MTVLSLHGCSSDSGSTTDTGGDVSADTAGDTAGDTTPDQPPPVPNIAGTWVESDGYFCLAVVQVQATVTGRGCVEYDEPGLQCRDFSQATIVEQTIVIVWPAPDTVVYELTLALNPNGTTLSGRIAGEDSNCEPPEGCYLSFMRNDLADCRQGGSL